MTTIMLLLITGRFFLWGVTFLLRWGLFRVIAILFSWGWELRIWSNVLILFLILCLWGCIFIMGIFMVMALMSLGLIWRLFLARLSFELWSRWLREWWSGIATGWRWPLLSWTREWGRDCFILTLVCIVSMTSLKWFPDDPYHRYLYELSGWVN